jgi:hypothetical protein
MNVRGTFVTKSELIISSFALLVVVGLFYKGVSSFLVEDSNPIFQAVKCPKKL